MKPTYDLIATNPAGEKKGYFIFPQAANPIVIRAQAPQLTGGIVESPTSAGGVYTVRDQDQPALVFTDWTKGAGQESYETEEAQAGRFHSSFAIDTRMKGNLRLAHASELTEDDTVEGLLLSALGYVFMSFAPTGSAPPYGALRYWDGTDWTSLEYDPTEPSGSVVTLATDGKYVYAVFAGDGIWCTDDPETDCTEWSSETGITGLCASGGYMYGCKADSVGYFDAATAYNQLSPVWTSAVTVGIATAGNWVYWLTSSAGVARLYRTQFDGTNEWFEDVCDFPTGFTATSIVGYLGNIFIGGYYECEEEDSGQGALYVVTGGTPTLLTTIGENPDFTDDPSSIENDNRVWRLLPSGKDLYITCTRKILRWDLDDGGWVQVVDIPQGGASKLVWMTDGDLYYTADALPDPGTWLKSGAAVASVAGGILTIPGFATNYATYEALVEEGKLYNETGTTMEVGLPADSAVGDGASHIFGFFDGYHGYQVTTRLDALVSPKVLHLLAGNDDIPLDVSIPHVVRLTLSGALARVYVDGVLVSSLVSQGTSADYVVFGSQGGSPVLGAKVLYDYVRISDSGAIPPGSELPSSNIQGMTINGKTTYVGIMGIGSVESTSSYETSGWLRQSLSASHSGSLVKQYHSIIVSHEPLGTEETLSCYVYIDGTYIQLPEGVTNSTETVFAVNLTGHDISPVIVLGSNGDTTPVVHSLTVTYDFPRYLQHTMALDCRRGAADGLWNEDPETAIKFLADMVNTGGFFETRYDSFTGVVQDLQFLEANRSAKGGFEGIIQLVVREVG